MTDIILISPPSCGIERPSIGLGILQARLLAAERNTRVHYANLSFAEWLGLPSHTFLEQVPTFEGLVDWVFAEAAFRELAPQDDGYLPAIWRRYPFLTKSPFRLSDEKLYALRARASEFVDAVCDRVLQDRPKIVGCSSTFSQHVASLAILRRIRERAPAVTTLMGGANCESVMGRATHRHFDWVDYVVSGEADELITPLCHHILDGPNGQIPLGVFAPEHRTIGYPAAATPDGAPRATVSDMAAVPLPDYSDYFTELATMSYRDSIVVGLPFETSRGCWWGERSHCTFCGLNGGNMRYRAKSDAAVVEDLRTLYQRYGVPRFSAVDNIADMGYFDGAFRSLAEEGGPYTIFYETKSNLNREHVETLAGAGVRWIQPGIESLHTSALKAIKKGVTAIQNVLLLKWTRQYGVFVHWNLLYGIPDEEDQWYEEMADLIPALTHLQPGTPILLSYHRFSPYYMTPEQFGLELKPKQSYAAIYPVPEEALAEIAYYFDDVTVRVPKSRPGLIRAIGQLNRWTELWNARPRIICCLHKRGAETVITDTRPCATSEIYVVDTEDQTILAAAAIPITRARLSHDLVVQGLRDVEVDRRLDTLLSRRFLIDIDGRLMSVVLQAPVGVQPAMDTFPSGLTIPKVLERKTAALNG